MRLHHAPFSTGSALARCLPPVLAEPSGVSQASGPGAAAAPSPALACRSTAAALLPPRSAPVAGCWDGCEQSLQEHVPLVSCAHARFSAARTEQPAAPCPLCHPCPADSGDQELDEEKLREKQAKREEKLRAAAEKAAKREAAKKLKFSRRH